MAKAKPLIPFFVVLKDLSSWLQEANVPGIIIGGIAASLLGRPRLTRDVDLVILIEEDNWEHFLASGSKFGFQPRLPNAIAFAKKARMLLVQHQLSAIDVDIALGSLPFEDEAIARALWVDIGNVKIPIATPEDLIIMKTLARRARDIADIEALLDANLKLDLKRIRHWVGQFSTTLDMPQLLTELNELIAKRRKK